MIAMRFRVVFGLLFGAPMAIAEPASAGLRGRVVDDSGLALPGVTVAVACGSESSTGATDGTGAYALAGLAAGQCQVSFRLPSFASSVSTVRLERGTTAELDATLRVALTADVLVTDRRTFRNLTDLDGPITGLLGLANAGSEGVVASRLIEQRPVHRAAEIFESVPGVVTSQHSGEGKANQYYVRGFNIDHGTDLATFVALHGPDPRTGRRERPAGPLRRLRRDRSRRDPPIQPFGRMEAQLDAGPHAGQSVRDRLRARPVLELHLLPRGLGEWRPVRAGGRAHHPRG